MFHKPESLTARQGSNMPGLSFSPANIRKSASETKSSLGIVVFSYFRARLFSTVETDLVDCS